MPTPQRSTLIRLRMRPRGPAVLAAAATVAGGLLAFGVATGPAHAAASRGATVPFTEYEAEASTTNGSVIGPDRTAGTLASEASGRKAVTLSGQGKYVQFTLTQPANAVTIHYAIPDTSDGTGQTQPLSLYVGSSKVQDLSLTSKYADYYGSYPFSNNPGDGHPHHFYDDVRARFSSTLAVGTTVKLQVDAGDNAASYTIDTADFENVPAASVIPSGYLNATSYGADPSGAADSTSALQSAINAASAQGKGLFIPTGTFTVTGHLMVNNVTIQGAGPWYTVLHGSGVGIYGGYVPNGGSNVHVSDLEILGETMNRDDGAQVNGIGGALSNSSFTNIWIQHTKVGAWMDGPMDHLTLSGLRILDTTADGVNFHDGVTNSSVTNSFLRNTGDDGLAMWSESNADSGDSFTFNTVELPILANNIALYGGHDDSVTDNIVSDTQTQGGGLHIGQRFGSTPESGTFTLARNTLIRTGVLDPNWQFGVGAIWFYSEQGAMSATVNVTDSQVLDSSYEAIQFIGNSPITGVAFSNITVDGTGTFVLQEQENGSASFSNVTAAHVGAAGIYNCLAAGAFTATKTNSPGWDTTFCGAWPNPVYTYGDGGGTTPPTSTPPTDPPTSPPPASGNLAQGRPITDNGHTQVYTASNAVDGNTSSYWEGSAFPSTLTVDLGSAQALGSVQLNLPPAAAWASRTQTVSIDGSTNGTSWTNLVVPKGYGFDPATGNQVSINLPSSTSARYVRLTFTANSGATGGQLSELGVFAAASATSTPPTTTPPPPTGNLALHRTVTETSHSDVYAAANVVDGNTSSYWESANNAFPQSITLDLGSAQSVRRLVLDLPPATAWATRSQTIAVTGSSDNTSFASLVGATSYTFNPATGNTVTIALPANTNRYLKLTFTANSGWPAGQLSELEAYAS